MLEHRNQLLELQLPHLYLLIGYWICQPKIHQSDANKDNSNKEKKSRKQPKSIRRVLSSRYTIDVNSKEASDYG
jgi:hypothetical protein